MKQELSRAEKVALMRQLAQELDVKHQKRVPLEPRSPAPPPNDVNRKLGADLKQRGDIYLTQPTCERHVEIETDERAGEALKSFTASLNADPTNPFTIVNRAGVHKILKMWKETEDDCAWAEQLFHERSAERPLTDEETTALVTALYYAACAQIELGRFEDAHSDLHAAQGLVIDNESVNDTLERVHAILDDYKARFGSNIQAHQLERISKFNSYGFTPYELALLHEAGIPPWYRIAKIVMKTVNELKANVNEKKSREHHEMQQCHNCWKRKSDGVSLSVCAKCKAALYCSRECQQKAWPGHKAHCKNAAAAREEADSAEVKAHPLLGGQVDDLPSGGDLLSALQGWTGKHRPLLAKSLVYALNLARDPKAHLIKTMIVMVQWMSGQRSTTTRFRVVAADVREIATLGGPTADDILKTRANLDAEHRHKGGFGVGILLLRKGDRPGARPSVRESR